MDARSLLTLLQKRPNEGMKELMRQYMGSVSYTHLLKKSKEVSESTLPRKAAIALCVPVP